MKILVASTNKGKLKEIREILGASGISAEIVLPDENFPEIDETGNSFQENALIKARTAFNIYQIPVLADDSGLCINNLGGKPGIYSARYAGSPVDDEKNITRILAELSDTPKPWKAFYQATLAFVSSETEIVCDGYIHGTIVPERSGHYGFGYDPVFVPEGFSKTMAEFSPDEKNAVSHRNMALQAFCQKFIQSGLNLI